MAKRVVSFFLALVLSLAVSVPSFAFEVATSSNAEPSVLSGISTGIDDAILSIRPFSSLASVDNTVDYSGINVRVEYFISSSDTTRYRTPLSPVSSSGHVSLSKPSNYPDSDAVAKPNLYIEILSPSLPSPGVYQFQLDLSSATNITYSNSFSLRSQVSKKNVGPQVQWDYDVSALTNAGDLYTSSIVDLGANLYNLTFYALNVSDISWPLSLDLDISFTSSALTPDFSTSPDSDLSQDIQNDIYGSVSGISSSVDSISSSIDSVSEGIESINTNTGYMVNGLREMANTLEEIVATISNQLSALWDQLYNNMHLPQLANDDKNTELIVEAIDDIELDISADLEAQTDSINQNNDKNTDTIVNGYDSSSLDASNDALSSAMESQEAQEEQILEQISEPLEDFEFDNPITQYLSAFQMFGDFLQDLFVGSGGFKDVINLSFLMPIALIVIGMYRFKGGG